MEHKLPLNFYTIEKNAQLKIINHEIQDADFYLQPIIAAGVSQLTADWNGRSLFMIATDLFNERLNETLVLSIVRVPVDLADKQGDAIEPWAMELDVGLKPSADARMVVDAFARLENLQNDKTKSIMIIIL
jgi:hypothetical protein